jgi:peptidoglycan/xylan/chitin deacetylase (PgdA/CDA1 family)
LILAYHGVGDVPARHDPHGLFVRPREVERHIRTLRRWGYELLTCSAMAERVAAGEGAGHAALTFDDGFADNLHELLPILLETQAPATVFSVSSWLDRPHPDAPFRRLLTRRELAALHAAGIEIGGHTATHPDLTTLTPEKAQEELARGRRELEEVIEAPVTVAAYPFGRATAETRQAARDAGFSAAVRTTGQGSWSDPFDLPRQDVEAGVTRLGFRLKRDDRYEPLVRTFPGRAARRILRHALAVVR